MNKVNSAHFTNLQIASLERLGDLYAPGNGTLPSFTDTDCIEYLDDVLESVDEDDVFLLGILLLVMKFIPVFAIRWGISAMDHHDRYPEWIASWLRLISLGVKGVIMSLYFSGLQGANSRGPNVYDAMGYALHCEPDA
ncbi:hypothetical protein A9Q99_16545 [Gammaproteobacteria bacterium 45_16_T64]|nr:hypothetical protein A9Q99_16545 [Gammaproteobacteria bacterium 45_16_T64]